MAKNVYIYPDNIDAKGNFFSPSTLQKCANVCLALKQCDMFQFSGLPDMIKWCPETPSCNIKSATPRKDFRKRSSIKDKTVGNCSMARIEYGLSPNVAWKRSCIKGNIVTIKHLLNYQILDFITVK